MIRTIAITTSALAFALALGACEKELHRNGAGYTGPVWRPVYAQEASAHDIEDAGAPVSRRRYNLRGAVVIRPGVSVHVDSLRGLFVYEVRSVPNAEEYTPIGFLTVPGITDVEEAAPGVVAVDNLGERVVLDLGDYPDFEIVERSEAEASSPPDASEPPAPGATDSSGVQYGDYEVFESPYFECPDPTRSGRFLGWRLSFGSGRDEVIGICRH